MSECGATLGDMDPVVALIIGLVVGIVLGAVIGLLVGRSRQQTTSGNGAWNGAENGAENPLVLEAQHAAALAEVRADEAAQRAELSADIAALQATASALREQLSDQQAQFKDLADRTRLEQLERTERERAESKVLQALTPVQESLRTMQQKVTDLEAQRSLQHGELSQQLRSATESEERLRVTTDSLASALRNNASRGVWGEAQLRNVVESAGLINRVDFNLQSSINSDAGAGRPDMVVRLPGGKFLAVDAKVPYNSYLEASKIPPTATGEEESRRKTLLGQHAKQVKSHVDALSAKTYWAGLTSSPDFTVAFIPSEPLLAAALEHDPGLLDYAFSKNRALASPVNLWAVLKTVAFTWQQDVLTEDAKRLFDLSKELYGRLGTLAEHADKLRRSIDSTVSSYNQFASSLEGRVLVTARKLNELDESKVIGTPVLIDQQPKQLTAIELELPA
jgi:DNA recombination protein RmuC